MTIGPWLVAGHLGLAVLVGARSGAAQADSLSAVARAHYREAVAAEKKGDLVEARDLLVKAHQAWPLQPAYPLAAAELSARLRDTIATARLLNAFADLGAGRDLASLESFAGLRGAPPIAAAWNRLLANLAPLAKSDSVAGIADAEFYPEGMDYDPKSKSWFVASIRKRTIARIDAGGRVSELPRPGAQRLDAVLGVRVDSGRGIVWATTRALPQMEGYEPGDGSRARVMAMALGTGVVLGGADAPKDGAAHLFGDLVIQANGDVYLTDSETPGLFRVTLRHGTVTLDRVVQHRLFRSLQGLAFDGAEKRLYVADYSHGLLVVELETGTVREVTAPAGVTTLGLDGIAWYRGAIIGVQNGMAPPRIVRLDLSPDGNRVATATVIDRHLAIADEPTIGAVVGDRFVYVANSQWEKYGDDGRRKPDATLRPPVLLAVPLGR